MLFLLIHWAIVASAVLLAAHLVPGLQVSGWGPAFVAALVLGALNLFIKPLLVALTLPLTILTFGLFLLVINAVIISLVGYLVPGFRVRGFWAAIFASILISLFSAVGDALLDRDHEHRIQLRVVSCAATTSFS